MILVGAALGDDLNLCAAEASILGVIAVGEDFYTVDRVFRRCNDRRSAPDGARGADTVDRNAVILVLLPGGQRLRTVFRLENTLVAAGRARPLCSWEVCGATAISLGTIAEDARRQLDQLEDVAPERRHILNLVVGNGTAEGRGLRVN